MINRVSLVLLLPLWHLWVQIEPVLCGYVEVSLIGKAGDAQ